MSDTQESARRCSTCCLSWPALFKYYSKCPQCGGDTDVISNPGSGLMSKEEAASRLNQINFERHLAGEPLLPAPEPSAKAKEQAAKPVTPVSEARKSKFYEVIAGAGFRPEEVAEIEKWETLVANNKPGDQIESD
jgi:hypothetical protein